MTTTQNTTKETTMTTAERIAARFEDDGQRFRTRDTDEYLGDVCAAEPGAWKESENDLTKYTFSDGSALILACGGWDFLDSACTCGWCWDGADEECPGDD